MIRPARAPRKRSAKCKYRANHPSSTSAALVLGVMATLSIVADKRPDDLAKHDEVRISIGVVLFDDVPSRNIREFHLPSGNDTALVVQAAIAQIWCCYALPRMGRQCADLQLVSITS